jgi:hypothetical protein
VLHHAAGFRNERRISTLIRLRSASIFCHSALQPKALSSGWPSAVKSLPASAQRNSEPLLQLFFGLAAWF